jgi:lysyl-tRNA synthetase class 1
LNKLESSYIFTIMANQSVHWADITADQIIRQKGEKDMYVCASGITPSGTVHIGNFREIISVDLVVKALRSKGKQVRFIYSWDDYDVFRKVPKNMPKQEELAKFLRKPIISVPDPWGKEESYARANEVAVEKMLPVVGIEPEFLYQASKYMSSEYAAGIRKALEGKETIKALLNEHRSVPLGDDWWPVSVFCASCSMDNTSITGWNGEWEISYSCADCGHKETVDLREAKVVKLPWRVDWPMRWKHEGVDFEPAGKEHHSAGGSFDTAKNIVEAVFGGEAPVTFKYDFISIKGMGGKISSSTGNVISLPEVLKVYQPELVRYLFAGTRPNTEFAISFDLDVLKIYEDYDKAERVYFGAETMSKKREDKEKRAYELSQVGPIPESLPFQVSIRHLGTILQIFEGDIQKTLHALEVPEQDRERIAVRSECAWNWIREFSPEDFRFTLKKPGVDLISLSENEKQAVAALAQLVKTLDSYSDKELNDAIYETARSAGLEPQQFFLVMYRILIGKEKGPKLAAFINTIGEEAILSILSSYL